MRYILLFIAIFTFSCKYNITSPVGTIKDYSANSGKLFYTSSGDSDNDIETTLKKNKHSLGKYLIKVSPTNDKSTAILTNIKEVLNKNLSFNNVEIDLSQTKITNIPKDMFTNTTNLGKITLPDTVTNIEESAFSGCSSLVNLFLPKSLTKIDNDAFKNCSQLKNLEYLGTKSDCSKLDNCQPFSSGSNLSNLYLPSMDGTSTNIINSNFLGRSWTTTNYGKHIPN